MGTITLVAYLSIVQPFILNLVLNIHNNVGNITGSLALYDEIIALPATLCWGVLSDRVGRRPVYSIGFICLGAALMLYPRVENVYPHMLLCRLLFSLGSSAATCMMTGTLGDVAGAIHERGRVSAIVGFSAGCGGLIAGLVLLSVPYDLADSFGGEMGGMRAAFIIVGGCAMVLGILLFFTMPATGVGEANGVTGWFKKTVLKKEIENEYEKEIISPFKLLKYGFVAARDPRVALAYLSSFVARADTVLFSSFMSLWVIHYYSSLGWCSPDRRITCFPAVGSTHTLTGYGQGISLAFAPLYGYAAEKFEKSTVLGFAGFMGAIGSLPFAFTKTDPAHKSNLAFVTMTGIGQMGVIIVGMTLVNGLNVDPKYRGSVAGVFSFCGALSIMITARLGGYLFDEWMPGAPFVIMGVVHILICLMSIYVRIVTPRLKREDLIREEARQKREAKRLEDLAAARQQARAVDN
ncbi:MAG: major facilitator superfamily domain-containing protein [Linnemannia gamsii]|nr:MAG: major facilitator superfamily domain-containing protein [Linnemannia gamsii]